MRIVFYVHDLKFPLAEGYRKEAWLLAKVAKAAGHGVEIVSTRKKKGMLVKGGIKITYGSALKISKVKADIIHYISQPSPLIVPLLMRAKAKKQIMTIFGGELNSFWKRKWDVAVSKLVNKKISRITVQTDYQMDLFRNTRLEIPVKKIPPLVPILEEKVNRSEKPSLLFMSHMDRLKGINDVLKAFLFLRKRIKGLTLIIADSGLTKDNEMYKRIEEVNKGDIILKKIVNPQEELAKAWVYLYPIRSARETFSVPLSLIEAIQVGTPYISTNVGGIPEYFDERCLVEAKDVKALAAKIEEFIKHPKVYPMKKKINIKEVVEEYLELYQ